MDNAKAKLVISRGLSYWYLRCVTSILSIVLELFKDATSVALVSIYIVGVSAFGAFVFPNPLAFAFLLYRIFWHAKAAYRILEFAMGCSPPGGGYTAYCYPLCKVLWASQCKACSKCMRGTVQNSLLPSDVWKWYGKAL